MQRTTENASELHVLVIGLDGKSKTAYMVRPPQAAFFDLANTLDHARNTGLEPTDTKSGEVQPPSVYDGTNGKVIRGRKKR